MAGVAFGAKVVPVRVLGKCGGYTSDIANGIIWASGGTVTGVPANANPAEVINMSLGGARRLLGAPTRTRSTAPSAVAPPSSWPPATATSTSSGARPANCANVITVAATNQHRHTRQLLQLRHRIDLAAPGSATS